MRCDCHLHIVGPLARYPQVANRTYIAGPASVADLERVAAPRNVRRFVIVQPSFYGTDNMVTLEGLDALGGRGRGVAVIDPSVFSVTDSATYTKRGIRGLRINLYTPLGVSAPLAERFRAIEDIALSNRWHIQVIAPLATLVAEAALLGAARVPVVFDHYGLYAGHRPDSSAGQAFLALLRKPHVWIKLSGPYRLDAGDLATRPDTAWLQAILSAAPDRCVWGSDWPHTPPHELCTDGNKQLPYRALRYNDLVDHFIEAVGSDERAERILSDNPVRLYGF